MDTPQLAAGSFTPCEQVSPVLVYFCSDPPKITLN
jgi:hypothetical protein